MSRTILRNDTVNREDKKEKINNVITDSIANILFNVHLKNWLCKRSFKSEMSDLKILSEPDETGFFKVSSTDERWKKFPSAYLGTTYYNILPIIKKFEVFVEDIYLSGLPRTGTTMVAEMIWLMVNSFDFEKAASLITNDRVVGME